MEADEKDVKECLVKIKTNASYEDNMKTLHSLDVKIVHMTAKYLEVFNEGYVKEGAAYAIIKKLYSLMPHKCDGCKKEITNSIKAKETHGVVCETFFV